MSAMKATGGARRAGVAVTPCRSGDGSGIGDGSFAADAIAEWFDAGAADGFDIMPAVPPSELEAFVDRVVPLLQERGLFRTEYAGTSLRDHYGLVRPANRRGRSKVGA